MAHDLREIVAQPRKIEARCAEIAARQWGVIDLAQLYECGLSDGAVRTRVRNGILHPLYRGVYAFGDPAIPVEGLFLAAVKACGPDAVLSHFSAAVLYGFFEWDDRYPQVTAPTPRRHKGIRTYQSENVERTYFQGIPVTPPARTLIDLAATIPFNGVRRAVNEAFNQRLIAPADLVVLDRRGARVLRKILATAAPTKNEYEDTVLAILDGLPRPHVNVPLIVAGTRYIPDYRWPEHHLILEADSRRFHDQSLARADDKHRQAILEAHGERVLRTTWREATLHPGRVRARVEAALGETMTYRA